MSRPYIFIANDPDALEEKLGQYKNTVTVEAEYGEREVKGSCASMSHHGPRSNNPAPCLQSKPYTIQKSLDAIGISHVDLDTIGGIMTLVDSHCIQDSQNRFWEAAAFVDVHGPHKINEFLDMDNEQDQQIHYMLAAYWDFSQNHRIFPPSDGNVKNVQDEINDHIIAVQKILLKESEMIEKGKTFLENSEKLNKESLAQYSDFVILRDHSLFTNHLYNLPKHFKDQSPRDAVVAYNPTNESVILSFAEQQDISCVDVVQDLWGNEAGGKDVIAGSPRARKMSYEDALKLFFEVHQRLKDSLEDSASPK